MRLKDELYTGCIRRGGCEIMYYDEDKEPYEEPEQKQDNTKEA
jgi:hypothetical protein